MIMSYSWRQSRRKGARRSAQVLVSRFVGSRSLRRGLPRRHRRGRWRHGAKRRARRRCSSVTVGTPDVASARACDTVHTHPRQVSESSYVSYDVLCAFAQPVALAHPMRDNRIATYPSQVQVFFERPADWKGEGRLMPPRRTERAARRANLPRPQRTENRERPCGATGGALGGCGMFWGEHEGHEGHGRSVGAPG